MAKAVMADKAKLPHQLKSVTKENPAVQSLHEPAIKAKFMKILA